MTGLLDNGRVFNTAAGIQIVDNHIELEVNSRLFRIN
jgi:hypothetical protein